MSLYGTPGIIDTPTARWMPDGHLASTVSTKRPDDRITLAFQALPWLEVTARYSVINKVPPPSPAWYDRSVGFKLRVLTEGRWRPAVAVGLLDVGGTLVYGGEYIVASKRFGPIDSSLGMGFGRLGSTGMLKNPFGALSSRFYSRPTSATIEQTGQVSIKQFFRGEDVSLFGGLVYDTPVRGLRLLVEYSGDKYALERDLKVYRTQSQVNYGVSYRPFSFVEAGIGWVYGNTLSLRLSLITNLKTMSAKLDKPAPSIKVRSAEERLRGALKTRLSLDDHPRARRLPSNVQLANAPDWSSIDIPAPNAPPDPVAANARAAESIRGELARLDMALESFGVEDTQALLLVVPHTGQAPLPCEVLWHQVSVSGLVGVDTVTFVNTAEGKQTYRCTKFVEPKRWPVALGRPALEPASRNVDTSSGTTAATAPAPGRDERGTRSMAQEVQAIFKQQGLTLEALKLEGGEAIVYFVNPTYQRAGQALGRAAAALTQVLPPNVEIITLIEVTDRINGIEFRIPRAELERVVVTSGSSEEVLASATVLQAEPGFPRDTTYRRRHFLRLTPRIGPGLRESLFDPDDPLRFQFYLKLGGTLELSRGIALEAQYNLDIYNTFDTIRRESNSVLPHVRSDFRHYLQQGDSGLDRLQLVIVKQLAPEWTARISAGYLEEMYGGVSGEVLYAPFASRWAIGGHFAQVWQRDFDKRFGFRDYDVALGDLALYYQTPYHGIDLKLQVGRYLAKDWGGTIEISRRFDNGAEIGAWATFTDVGFDKFGEGSFDKGIRITIPMDFFSLFSSRNAALIELSPVTRDGGARLYDGPRLYPEVRRVSFGEALRTWDAILDGQ